MLVYNLKNHDKFITSHINNLIELLLNGHSSINTDHGHSPA